jgi:hypothetical protein
MLLDGSGGCIARDAIPGDTAQPLRFWHVPLYTLSTYPCLRPVTGVELAVANRRNHLGPPWGANPLVAQTFTRLL